MAQASRKTTALLTRDRVSLGVWQSRMDAHTNTHAVEDQLTSGRDFLNFSTQLEID